MITKSGQEFIKSGGNSAEMIDLNPDMVMRINTELANLTDTVLPAILGDEGGIFVTYKIEDSKILFSWFMGSRPHTPYMLRGDEAEYQIERQRMFSYSPTTETSDGFLDRIKAYFFDCCVILAGQR